MKRIVIARVLCAIARVLTRCADLCALGADWLARTSDHLRDESYADFVARLQAEWRNNRALDHKHASVTLTSVSDTVTDPRNIARAHEQRIASKARHDIAVLERARFRVAK